MAEEKKPELSKALTSKYQLKHVTPGEFLFKGDKYNTTTMDEATAEKLVKDGCPYIEKAGGTTTAKAPGNP